jgi:hypothetical protein
MNRSPNGDSFRSASDHSLPVFTAGGASSTSAPSGIDYRAADHAGERFLLGISRAAQKGRQFLYPSPGRLTGHSLGAARMPSPLPGREPGTSNMLLRSLSMEEIARYLRRDTARSETKSPRWAGHDGSKFAANRGTGCR